MTGGRPVGGRGARGAARILGALLLAGGWMAAAVTGRPTDWPQHLGPDRQGTVSRVEIPAAPSAGYPVVWKSGVGEGFSGPLVVSNRVLLHHRRGAEEILEAFEAGTGRSVWQARQPTRYADDFGFDEGPRATPLVAGGTVFTFGAEGRVTAVALADGALRWTVPAAEKLGAGKGFFGFGASPLAVGTRLVVQLGATSGAGVVALEQADGRVAWQALDEEAGYGSPVLATWGGQSRLVCFNRAGLRLLDPETGRRLAGEPWRARMAASVNAASPLVLDRSVFITASYGTGAALFDWEADRLTRRWSGDESLSAHYATPVVVGGHLYGFHGRQEEGPEFRCVEWSTGRVRWTSGRIAAGSVIALGETLVLVLENGELVLAAADPAKWAVRHRQQILGSGTRALPAFGRGLLVARDKARVVAVRLAE